MDKKQQKTDEKQIRFDLSLSEELDNRLNNFCMASGTTKRAVVNIALNDFLASRGF